MMDKAERNAVWHESVDRFGTRLQSVVCMEECAELIQAVSKRLRGKPDPDDNLAEEMADVVICLHLLQDMYDVTDERLESWIDRKTERQVERNRVRRRANGSRTHKGTQGVNATTRAMDCLAWSRLREGRRARFYLVFPREDPFCAPSA